MESYNCNLIVKLIYLLETNRDGLILIDGKWGTGKTYFIKNRFPTYYNLNTFYYISLLGVKSLADFKAKVIDCYYLQDINTLKSGLDTLSSLGSISSGSPASANVLNGMFNSIGASVRENILSKLSGVFILDDIERIIDNSLANEILTYCHSLYTSPTNDNLDFIVISNTSTESHLQIQHKEKIISDSLHYNPSPRDILEMELIENQLKYMPLNDRMAFEEITTYNSIVNLRILIRALKIAAPLYLHAKENTELDWKIPSGIILSSITSFFILLFTYNKTVDDLVKEREFYIPNPSNDSDPHETKLWSLLNNYKIGSDIKKYYSGHTPLSDILDIIFHEPHKLSITDIATSHRPELQDVNEEKLNTEIINIISKHHTSTLNLWLSAVRNYEYLTFHKYLPKSSLLTLQYMTSKLIEFSNEEVISYFDLHDRNSNQSFDNGLDDGNLLFKILAYRHQYIMKEFHLRSIKKKIEIDGWATFDVGLLSNLDPYGSYKIFEVLGAPFLTKCILKKWKVLDIEQFNALIRSNYRISNIAQFANNEKNPLIYLSQKLDIFCLSNKEGFKYGAINDLNKTVKQAISCM